MGMVRQWQDLFYEQGVCRPLQVSFVFVFLVFNPQVARPPLCLHHHRCSATEMYNPCYSTLANAMGNGIQVADKDDLESLSSFLACDGPCVLDALCEKESTLPDGAGWEGPPRDGPPSVADWGGDTQDLIHTNTFERLVCLVKVLSFFTFSADTDSIYRACFKGEAFTRLRERYVAAMTCPES